jgi:hypothetical protein
VAKPKFGAKDNYPHFREAVEFAMQKGPNFAGTYTLVQTSCGTACAGIALVDDRTGEIISSTPFGEVHFGSPIKPYGKVSYHRNSRLLIIEGRIEGVSELPARAYYEWRDSRFRLLELMPLGNRGQ